MHVPGEQLETSAAIEARTLSKRYGSIEAVRGIDLDVATGETVALLGPNGAGKSTTIDMILGLSEPDGGAVSVFGGSPAAAIGGGLVGAMLQSGGADPRPVGAGADRDGRLAVPASRSRSTTRCS